MKKSLEKKICLSGSLLIVAFVLINVILTYFFMAPFSTLFYRDQMSDLGDSLEEMKVMSGQPFEDAIDEFDAMHGVKITMIDSEKNVLHTTRVFLDPESAYWKMSMELFDSDFDKIDKGEKAFITRNKQRKNDKKTIQLIMIQKISEDCYVVMSRNYRSLQNAMYSAIIFDLTVGIFIILLGWIVVYRLSHYLVIPIRNMTVTAERISNLDFDSKVELKSKDELGQLGISINKMSEQLEANMLQLQEDIEGRKRLVRNLSHEIKSPIAVIMGYSDRLKNMILKDPEKALEYCEIISNESARIDLLVKEMLELSKMEQKSEGLHMTEFEADSLFSELKSRVEKDKLERNIIYKDVYNITDTIFADYTLLERAVYNLIRNAMMHGMQDELRITVSGERKEEYYEIRVFNSGSNINEAEVSSLWEPFNKADKVRTRSNQGYGVGLAIVREIIESHEGYYSVQNVEDGVEFLIAVKG